MVRRRLTPTQAGELERLYRMEFRRLLKAGEPAPYASMMAARLQLIEQNKMLAEPLIKKGI